MFYLIHAYIIQEPRIEPSVVQLEKTDDDDDTSYSKTAAAVDRLIAFVISELFWLGEDITVAYFGQKYV